MSTAQQASRRSVRCARRYLHTVWHWVTQACPFELRFHQFVDALDHAGPKQQAGILGVRDLLAPLHRRCLRTLALLILTLP